MIVGLPIFRSNNLALSSIKSSLIEACQITLCTRIMDVFIIQMKPQLRIRKVCILIIKSVEIIRLKLGRRKQHHHDCNFKIII